MILPLLPGPPFHLLFARDYCQFLVYPSRYPREACISIFKQSMCMSSYIVGMHAFH